MIAILALSSLLAACGQGAAGTAEPAEPTPALWEPEPDRWSAHRCPFHPFRSLPRRENACLDYGADMTLLLQYYQAMDHWQDEGKHGARRRALRLRRAG